MNIKKLIPIGIVACVSVGSYGSAYSLDTEFASASVREAMYYSDAIFNQVIRNIIKSAGFSVQTPSFNDYYAASASSYVAALVAASALDFAAGDFFKIGSSDTVADPDPLTSDPKQDHAAYDPSSLSSDQDDSPVFTASAWPVSDHDEQDSIQSIYLPVYSNNAYIQAKPEAVTVAAVKTADRGNSVISPSSSKKDSKAVTPIAPGKDMKGSTPAAPEKEKEKVTPAASEKERETLTPAAHENEQNTIIPEVPDDDFGTITPSVPDEDEYVIIPPIDDGAQEFQDLVKSYYIEVVDEGRSLSYSDSDGNAVCRVYIHGSVNTYEDGELVLSEGNDEDGVIEITNLITGETFTFLPGELEDYDEFVRGLFKEDVYMDTLLRGSSFSKHVEVYGSTHKGVFKDADDNIVCSIIKHGVVETYENGVLVSREGEDKEGIVEIHNLLTGELFTFPDGGELDDYYDFVREMFGGEGYRLESVGDYSYAEPDHTYENFEQVIYVDDDGISVCYVTIYGTTELYENGVLIGITEGRSGTIVIYNCLTQTTDTFLPGELEDYEAYVQELFEGNVHIDDLSDYETDPDDEDNNSESSEDTGSESKDDNDAGQDYDGQYADDQVSDDPVSEAPETDDQVSDDPDNDHNDDGHYDQYKAFDDYDFGDFDFEGYDFEDFNFEDYDFENFNFEDYDFEDFNFDDYDFEDFDFEDGQYDVDDNDQDSVRYRYNLWRLWLRWRWWRWQRSYRSPWF